MLRHLVLFDLAPDAGDAAVDAAVAALRGLAEERTRFADLMTTEDVRRLMAEMNAGKRDIRDR